MAAVQVVQVHHRGHRGPKAKGQGTLQKVCVNPECPGASPQTEEASSRRTSRIMPSGRPSSTSSGGTGRLGDNWHPYPLCIGAAVPGAADETRLLFVVERLAAMLDENRLAIVARQHGIKKAKDSDSIGKLFASLLSP